VQLVDVAKNAYEQRPAEVLACLTEEFPAIASRAPTTLAESVSLISTVIDLAGFRNRRNVSPLTFSITRYT